MTDMSREFNVAVAIGAQELERRMKLRAAVAIAVAHLDHYGHINDGDPAAQELRRALEEDSS